ncbi:MAG TPA: Ig-like domain-containing protein, partial [Candidatus Methylomirabilis sp.]|nr:Ig-like domain-containing protein [Candidatus Methylomirabilis sp.]
LANDTDVEGNPLTIVAVTQGANGTVLNDGNSVTYTSSAAFSGTDSFSYTVSDGSLTATAAVTVTVSAAAGNSPPVAVNDAAATDAGVPVTLSVLANDTDPNGNLLTVTAVGAPVPATSGSVTFNVTSVTFTPTAGFIGSVTFPYTVSDGSLTATAAVTVTVNAVVTGEITVTRAEFKAAGTEWRVDGTGTIDGNTVTIHLGSTLNGTVVGTANVAGGLWTFRARPGLPLPTGTTTISAESSGGGRLLAFPIRVR